jgi:16S rRNA G1207 methylase RsmC
MSAPALLSSIVALCDVRVFRSSGTSAVIAAVVSSNKKLRKTCKRVLTDWLNPVEIQNFPVPEGFPFVTIRSKRLRDCDSSRGATDNVKVTSFKWTVAPGLFAGGVVDIMTLAMIKCLERPREHSRNLDYACGSGIITKWLLLSQPACRVAMCDNDTVALEVAKINNPDAEAVLSDSWVALSKDASFDEGSHAFDNIYSNPPLHRGKLNSCQYLSHLHSHAAGQPDDFVVLRDLCVGAVGRLVSGGSLYIVAQAQVPVGAFLRMAKPKYARIEVSITADNRFVLWKAVAK